MKYVIRWNTRNRGPVYLASTDSYARGTGQGFTTSPDEALQFANGGEALTAVQNRALAIDDVNSKLELVTITGGRVQVGAAV